METPLKQYERFVAQTGGTRVIRRLLVANNGMAARKFIMSVCMHSNCPHVGHTAGNNGFDPLRCPRRTQYSPAHVLIALPLLQIRNWLFQSFGDSSLIHIISMATPEDIKANATHLHSADAFFEVC